MNKKRKLETKSSHSLLKNKKSDLIRQSFLRKAAAASFMKRVDIKKRKLEKS